MPYMSLKKKQVPNPVRAFYPVTDGAYITTLATAQLSEKKVNGKNLLVGVSTFPSVLPGKELSQPEQRKRGPIIRTADHRHRGRPNGLARPPTPDPSRGPNPERPRGKP